MPNHNLIYQDVLLVECLEAIRTLPAHLYTQQISQVVAKIEDHLSLAIPVTTFNRFAKKYYSPFNRKKFNKISRVVNVTTQEYPKPKFKVHRPCRPQDIQPDVLRYICKIIHGKRRDNNRDLLNFGLTCKNWCKAALKELYYSPNFDSIEKLSNLSVSISYIDVKPRYVNYIQELHLPRVPESKNTILYRKHVESIAAGGNIVCLTAPSIKIDFLNRILFYCPNIERLSIDSVVLLDEESDNAVEIQMLAQQCECLMDVRFEFVESPKFIYEDSTDGGTDISQLQNEEYSFQMAGSSIPIPIGSSGSSVMSSSPPSKSFGGSSRFGGVGNKKSFDNGNVFMDRPASALSLSNYQSPTHTSSGSFEFPSGGVGNIAAFFDRPSSALSNASNTTNNSTSDLKHIVQMEDVVLNGLGRKLEVLVKRHLSLSAINGLVKHCPQLKKIRLIDPMDCLPSLPKFENLQTLDITTSRKSHIKQFSHIFNSRTFTRLEHIKIEYEPPNNRPIQRLDQLLFHFSMSAILSHCPRLKSLIHPIYPTTQDEFLNLLKTMRSLPDLRALSLRNFVNDRLLTTVSQKFPNLEALDISNTCYVSGYGIVDVVVNCVKLRYFGIHGIPICADDIKEIQRRLPKCHIFSQFDPKWIWSERMYYLWDTVIYKDDEWKKNENYEEEEEEEEESVEVTQENENENEIEEVNTTSEISESVQESEITQEAQEQESEQESENGNHSNVTSPTTPTISINPDNEKFNFEGIKMNNEADVPTPIASEDEEDHVEKKIPSPKFKEEKKSSSPLMNEFDEDNEELTIRGTSGKNNQTTFVEDNNSIDEDYINDDYSRTFNQQEEIIQDSSAVDTTTNLINIEEDDHSKQQNLNHDEDLQIKEDIKGLLENTIFMEDEKPSVNINDNKKTISGENITHKDSLYSFEE
ncbi:hypothetical protein H8356DRAFT_927146 [Neocallimastix lanati (nom. inval.)]|nr:hypothetical protein H8356DRAFT_927146 [Neocallimastix sp. JGI-2020a]